MTERGWPEQGRGGGKPLGSRSGSRASPALWDKEPGTGLRSCQERGLNSEGMGPGQVLSRVLATRHWST